MVCILTHKIMKNYYTTIINDISIKLFSFEMNKGSNEYYILFSVENNDLTFKEQIEKISGVYKGITASDANMGSPLPKDAKPAFKRFFLSDAANQTAVLNDYIKDDDCAVSVIQQPPLNGSKVALFAIFMTATENVRINGNLFKVAHNGIDELWATNYIASGEDSYIQTKNVMSGYAATLQQNNCTLADNCIRTWLYVNDIDNNYDGVVSGRNDVFDKENLTDKTHYIASTGIQGRDTDNKVLCKMDAVAFNGIKNEQIHYLYALDHLNRTNEYGVRFERGTYVDFAGRRRVYISGTASIDDKGNVLYLGDIRKQTLRMLENINALLLEADCSFDNVAFLTVYIRDTADYNVVNRMFKEHFPTTPYIIVHAPVCRPTWLIETECIAIKGLTD